MNRKHPCAGVAQGDCATAVALLSGPSQDGPAARRLPRASLLGLAIAMSIACLCEARGIQDPMNPQQYMLELANKMESASDRQILLGGTVTPASPTTPLTPTREAPVRTPARDRQVPTPALRPAGPRPGGGRITDEPQVRRVRRPRAGPWSLGTDLDRYRAHAVADGSRESGESLKKALERAGLAVADGINVLVLGYASDRAGVFRENDGIGLFEEPGKAPAQAGVALVDALHGVYSLGDLIVLDSLPDYDRAAYTDNSPLVRPLLFTGRTIGGAWKTTEEIGNALTWGYFDNVTGCIGLTIEDLVELAKHAGEALTNLVRLPVRLIAKDSDGAEGTMDWVLLVPLEFVSNAVAMKGISNMDDYETAFADKGVIGSSLELAGSVFVAYWAIDKLLDELDDDDNHGASSGQTGEPQEPSGPQVPSPDPVAPTTFQSEVVVVGEPMSASGAEIYIPLP